MSDKPRDFRRVEIFLDGQWIPATFNASNYAEAGGDEVWWFDYFSLDDGRTIPDDPQSGDALPRWRSCKH
jgi:hypothetical protein